MGLSATPRWTPSKTTSPPPTVCRLPRAARLGERYTSAGKVVLRRPGKEGCLRVDHRVDRPFHEFQLVHAVQDPQPNGQRQQSDYHLRLTRRDRRLRARRRSTGGSPDDRRADRDPRSVATATRRADLDELHVSPTMRHDHRRFPSQPRGRGTSRGRLQRTCCARVLVRRPRRRSLRGDPGRPVAVLPGPRRLAAMGRPPLADRPRRSRVRGVPPMDHRPRRPDLAQRRRRRHR